MLNSIDGYCERVAPGLWDEPLNLATGVLLMALGLWLAGRPQQAGWSRAMALVLAGSGISTVIFHMWPNTLTGILDMIPTVAFVGLLFFAYGRDILRLSRSEVGIVVMVIVPLVAASLSLLLLLDGPASTAGYAAFPVFLLGMATVLRQRDPVTARYVLAATAMFLAGIGLRAADLPLCASLPTGTHFLWHLMSGAVMTTLIEGYRRHLLAAGNGGG